jgi:hypothetical protein
MLGALARLGNQRKMPGVQSAHRGYERHPAPLGAERGDRFPKRLELTDGLHGDSGLI